MGRHFGHHNRVGSHLGIFPNLDIAEYFCAGGDDHMVTQSRVALALFLTGPAKGHALEYGDIIPDLAGFADDGPHSMIDEKTLSDPGPRMDLNAGQEPGDLGKETRDDRDFNGPQSMGD